MLRPSAIALIFAALQFSLSAANIQTRVGKTVSGSLQQLSEQGVWVNGQTFSWGIIRKADLAPAPAAKAELREVKTKIWRGSSTTFMEVLTRDPSTIDDVNRRLGRTPVAILFEGRLNAPRAGDYQFRLATDEAQQDKQTLPSRLHPILATICAMHAIGPATRNVSGWKRFSSTNAIGCKSARCWVLRKG